MIRLVPVLVFILAGCPRQAAGEPVPAVEASAPSADALLARYVDALGGAEVLERYDHMVSRATLSMPAQGIAGTMTVWAADPDTMWSVAEIPGLGEIQQGYHDGVGWALDPILGARLLGGPELALVARGADFRLALHWSAHYPQMEVLPLESVGETSAWPLRAVTPWGDEETHWFDATSGLLIQTRLSATTPMGQLPVTVTIGDYREQDGAKIPFRSVTDLGPMKQVLQLQEVQFEGEMPPYEVPAPIQALLDEAANPE